MARTNRLRRAKSRLAHVVPILAMTLFPAHAAFAEQWVRTSGGSVLARDAHFDMDSLKKEGVLFTVRTVENFRANAPSPKSTEQVIQIRCAPQGQRLVSSRSFTGPFAKGEEIPAFSAPGSAAEFVEIEKGNRPLYGLFCRGNR